MSYTPAEIADGVWTYSTRTVDGLAPSASDGSVLDNIAYAVWTYGTRTVEGGTGATFVVAESMPTPAQSSTAQNVMPVVVAELTLTPEQAAIAGTSITVLVNETIPVPSQSGIADSPINVVVSELTLAPVQSILANASGGAKKKRGGPWPDYYPPIYAIRTNGSQKAPAPGERVRARFNEAPKPEPVVIVEPRPVYTVNARQLTMAPIQTARVKSHREVKAMKREEQDILTLLVSL